MRNTILALFILGFSIFKVEAQDFRDPKSYLIGVGEIQDLVSQHTWDFNQNIAFATNTKRIEAERASFVGELKKINIRLMHIEGFNDDLTFKREILSYTRNMILYYETDCKRLIEYQSKSLESYDNMEKFFVMHEQMKQKILNETELLNVNQKKFAEKYNVKIIKNNSDVGHNLKKSSALSKYVAQVYLIFFKSNVTELHQTQAIDNNDAEAFFRNNQLLKQYSVEGLMQLAKMQNYEGDPYLNNAVKLILDAYINESNKILPIMTKYFDLDKKLKIAEEKVKSPTKTIEEVKIYNDLIQKMNDISAVYNTFNTKLNTQSKLIQKNWNEAQRVFLQNYIPQEKYLTSK